MSLFLYIVFYYFTGRDFCSSGHICSVLETASQSQREILNAAEWLKAYWYGRISANKVEGGKKRKRQSPFKDTFLPPKFIDPVGF